MMNDKKLERAAKGVTALLFVALVVMLAVLILVQLKKVEPEQAYIEIDVVEASQNDPVSPQNAVESKIDILEDTDEEVQLDTLQAIVKPSMMGAKPAKEVPVVADEPVVEEVKVDPEELELLAKVIYQEAGSDSCCDNCRRMVADVVLNRVADDRFPNTIYDVLMQERQYGRYHWTGVVWPERASYDSEKAAVERAYRIAEEVLNGTGHSDLYGQGYIWQAEFIQGTNTVTCDCDGSWIYFGR